jgi:hypothetical protein
MGAAIHGLAELAALSLFLGVLLILCRLLAG